MRYSSIAVIVGALCYSSVSITASAEEVYRPVPVDTLPALSKPGEFPVGVRTISLSLPQSFDVKHQQRYSRPLTVELWYPATGKAANAVYHNQTRIGKAFAIQGHALRDAAFAEQKELPLIVISHGYTGYRSLMFYLAEHLASHGYIVAGIDHTDSTNAEIDFIKAPFAGFLSTLYNRARDQQATLDYLLSTASPVAGKVSLTKAGLVGYSMGGFGALNTLGACYEFSPAAITQLTGATNTEEMQALQSLLQSCSAGRKVADERWQAALVLAPWGGQYRLFQQKSLQQIKTPVLYVAGDQDDVSGYDGVQWLFSQTGSSDKYLLTYHGARHNIAAHPAPLAARDSEGDYGHYADATWDSQLLNQRNSHFALAMFDCYLKQKDQACALLHPANSISSEGQGWQGFAPRYNTGMSWRTGDANQSGDK